MAEGSVRRLRGAAAAFCAGLGLLALPGEGHAQRAPVEINAARQVDGVQEITVDLRYGAGELKIGPGETGHLYDLHLQYDPSRIEPERSWSESGGSGTLTVKIHGTRDGHLGRIHAGSGDGSGFSDLSSLRLQLDRKVPAKLRLSVGAGDNELELGGIPVRLLKLETGASRTELSFSAPNPTVMEDLTLRVGASEFHGERLGNARFRRFTFEGGAGDVELDFTGAGWDGTAVGTVHMGIGSLDLRFPADLGVRLERSSFLAAFDTSGFVKSADGDYRTANWDSASRRLDLKVETALGSVDAEVVTD